MTEIFLIVLVLGLVLLVSFWLASRDVKKGSHALKLHTEWLNMPPVPRLPDRRGTKCPKCGNDTYIELVYAAKEDLIYCNCETCAYRWSMSPEDKK